MRPCLHTACAYELQSYSHNHKQSSIASSLSHGLSQPCWAALGVFLLAKLTARVCNLSFPDFDISDAAPNGREPLLFLLFALESGAAPSHNVSPWLACQSRPKAHAGLTLSSGFHALENLSAGCIWAACGVPMDSLTHRSQPRANAPSWHYCRLGAADAAVPCGCPTGRVFLPASGDGPDGQ